MYSHIRLAAICFILLLSTLSMRQAADGKAVVYAVVLAEACDKNKTVKDWDYKVTTQKDYYKLLKAFKEAIEKKYEGNQVFVEGSLYKYGPGVTNMAVIKWKVPKKKCEVYAIAIHFGKTAEEAKQHALTAKNNAAGKETPYSLEQINL